MTMVTYDGAVGEWAAELEAGRLRDAVDGSLGGAWIDVSSEGKVVMRWPDFQGARSAAPGQCQGTGDGARLR
jgi:hypothetical protein